MKGTRSSKSNHQNNRQREKGSRKKSVKRSVKNNESGWIGQLLRSVGEEFRSTFYAERKPKATTLLKEDHDKVKGLIQELKSARKNKMELVSLIEEEILVHSHCEETIFYPEVKKIDSEMVAESLEEHHQVDTILAELKEMTGNEEAFDAKVTVLEEMLKHHMEEEEGEMFPKAEKKLKEQLEELGAEIEYLKGELAAKRRKAA